ncbi:MAG: hypothetical protein AAF567_00730 [Actinomycetota bacterium]
MSARPPARVAAEALGLIHNVAYYSREMRDFAVLGLGEFWRAYVAWRCAPLGAVGPHAATAMLYNFAPRMVADALPSAWETTDPVSVLAMRDDCMDRALQRGLGDLTDAPTLVEASELLRRGIDAADPAGRALFAGHADLGWPDVPHLALWHGCTLWREYRGDAHNIALAAAEIDGLEAHVLLGGRGIVDAATIEKIRGWTREEWDAAVVRLADRGLLTGQGQATDEGIEYRRAIERHTDVLSAAPRDHLGDGAVARLIELVSPIAAHLVEVGAVVGRWPPPKPIARGS